MAFVRRIRHHAPVAGATAHRRRGRSSGNTHTIGKTTIAAATAGTIDITRETNKPWPDADVAALTTGTFKVALDCSAAASFTGPDTSANLKVDIRFVAYHEGD